MYAILFRHIIEENICRIDGRMTEVPTDLEDGESSIWNNGDAKVL